MDIEIRNTPNKGRGVFAAAPISAGTKHMSYGIALAPEHLTYASPLWMYVFGCKGSAKALVVLDWTSLINNSDNPNLSFSSIGYNRVEFVAKRDIRKGEELTINYRYNIYANAEIHGIDIDKWNKEQYYETDIY